MNYLTGKQIELRAVEPEDLDALYRWENDSSLWIYGSTVSPLSLIHISEPTRPY